LGADGRVSVLRFLGGLRRAGVGVRSSMAHSEALEQAPGGHATDQHEEPIDLQAPLDSPLIEPDLESLSELPAGPAGHHTPHVAVPQQLDASPAHQALELLDVAPLASPECFPAITYGNRRPRLATD